MNLRIDMYHHLVSVDELTAINERLDKIMATQTEHAQKLQELATKVAKIGDETAKSLELIKTLKDAQANAGNTSPEVDAATAALEAQLSKVDDMVPDASADVPSVA